MKAPAKIRVCAVETYRGKAINCKHGDCPLVPVDKLEAHLDVLLGRKKS